jgi:hypothetical protein
MEYFKAVASLKWKEFMNMVSNIDRVFFLKRAICLTILLLIAGQSFADQILFDIGQCDVSTLATQDVKLKKVMNGEDAVLRISSGHSYEWPGVDFAPAQGYWDLSAWSCVAMDVRNVGSNDVAVSLQINNKGGDGDHFCVKGGLVLQPGETGTLRGYFQHAGFASPEIKLFGMRGYPDGFPGDRNLDAAKIQYVRVFLAGPTENHVFEISNIRAEQAYVSPSSALKSPKTFFPFIDEFGQYIHKDWAGKVHSEAELRGNVAKEEKDLQANPVPKGWDKYGGWADGPSLKATGYFRVEKYRGKWWMVDPAGKLFFSQGIDCVSPSVGAGGTALDLRESWFKWMPFNDEKYKSCFSRHESPVYEFYKDKGIKPRTFDFYLANVMRKYGEGYLAKNAELTHRRLRSWGINTLGNWSSLDIALQRKTPYVMTIYFKGPLLEGSDGLWGKFWEVFDPNLPKQIQTYFKQRLGETINDPWCIGYFVDNEINWGDGTSLAIATLVSPAAQPAKKVFVDDLKAKYKTIDQLNKVWGTAHASWDALLMCQTAPDKAKAEKDLAAFNQKTIDQYFKVCRESIRAVAPNNLYLGCRFNSVNEMVDTAASKYCDVVSYNLYHLSIASFKTRSRADVPLMIGEFHFGALDRGMFHTGLQSMTSQEERAKAYLRYVQGALRHPQMVGCHWFQYTDQPTTGRSFDGENYQIGFVDICDTPNPEIIEAARQIGAEMYTYRLNAK